MLLPARPDQLHRLAHIARNECRLNRVLTFDPPIKTAARRHREQRDIARIEPGRRRHIAPNSFGHLARHPQLQLVAAPARRRAGGFQCGMQRRSHAVARDVIKPGPGKHRVGIANACNLLRRAGAQCRLQQAIDPCRFGAVGCGKARGDMTQRALSGPPVGRHRCQPALARHQLDQPAYALGSPGIESREVTIGQRRIADRGIDHARQAHVTGKLHRAVDL